MFLTMGGGGFIFLTATPTDDFFLFLKRIFFHSFASSLILQWLIALLDFFYSGFRESFDFLAFNSNFFLDF